MTQDEVRAAAERLVQFHERFAPLFGKEQAQDHAYTYVKGLMVCPERKSIEPIAIFVGDGKVSALQKFVGARQLVRPYLAQATLRIGSGNTRSGSARSCRQPLSSPLRCAASSTAKASTP